MTVKVATFEFKQEKEINALLAKYRIAMGTNVWVSNGMLAIPYEDGEEMNPAQKIIEIKEKKFAMLPQIDAIVQSQRVLEIQAKGIKVEMEKLNSSLIVTPKGKENYDGNKAKEKELKRLQNVLDQAENTMLMNQAELTRYMTNIAVFEERISQIESDNKISK